MKNVTEPSRVAGNILPKLMRGDFKSLMVFITLMDAGSLRAVAQVLGCTQAAVIMNLKRVRSYFLSHHFTRDRRGLLSIHDAIMLNRGLPPLFYLLSNTAACNTKTLLQESQPAL